MHICYLCNEYPPGTHGGVGTVTQTLARAFARRGHRVTVIGCGPALPSDIEEDDGGVRVLRLAPTRVRGGGLLLNGWRIRAALSQVHTESPIDIIEGPESSFAVLPKHFDIPTLIRMNGGHHFFSVSLGQRPRFKRGWIERRSFARADHLCAVSRFVARTTLDLLHQWERCVEIIPNIVDVSMFAPPSRDRTIDGLIVCTGTVCEKKGTRQLIEAMPRIVRDVPHAALWIVGRDSLDSSGGSYTETLRRLIPSELRERVEFRGAVPHADMPGVLAHAEVCVFPSHMEALPLAWLEGMAMAKAVVASNAGPGPEVIVDEDSGLLCDPSQPASIAECIVRVLTDKALRRRLGPAARRRAVALFSEQAVIEHNERFYKRCA
jgi:glycosyltransferase involved in cell wall biosynthesis